MRRKLSIIGVLLLTLCVSGWSGALAAVLSCPHAKGEAQPAMAHDHSCCHAKLAHKEEAQPSHCSSVEHKAMGDMQAMPAAVVADNAVASGELARSCAHCMERSEIPATPNSLQVNQIKRSMDAAASNTPTPLPPFAALFAPPVLHRQGSPPGNQTRKHLLLSVFII